MKCPCKDCAVRTEECHALCRGYGRWRAEKDEENAAVMAAKKLQADLAWFTIKEQCKTKKRKMNGWGC